MKSKSDIMYRILKFFVLIISFAGCTPEKETSSLSIPTGIWRGTLHTQGQEVPFGLEVERTSENDIDIYILNAQERLLLDEVTFEKDSVIIPLHIFDASIRARVEGHSMTGMFVKHYEKDYRIPFTAKHGVRYRFRNTDKENSPAPFGGKFRVLFNGKTDTTQAVGIFHQEGDSVSGTFLTPTGDYRYLQGNVTGDSMHLSTFDGNYVYLFKAALHSNDTILGRFYSGKTKNITWTGIRDENAALANAESLTYLKDGYEKIEFKFPDINGDTVSLSDDKYRDKVIILQILGTWCPNCMDETKFLSPWYDENKDRGVEIIGLAYERKDDFNYASARVRRMIEKMDVKYDVVIAGTNDKEKASESLPMLNSVEAFPTTIFIGRDGKVKKIHTGFSGPGTGVYYDQLIEEFNETVNSLLVEGEKERTAKL